MDLTHEGATPMAPIETSEITIGAHRICTSMYCCSLTYTVGAATILGRSSACNMVLDYRTVSTSHAKITLKVRHRLLLYYCTWHNIVLYSAA